MFKASANVAHALLAKLPSMAALFVFLGNAQDSKAEISIVSIFIVFQTFAFIVTQPSYLIVLREGRVRCLDAIIWLTICTLGILLIGTLFEGQGCPIYVVVYGLLSLIRGILTAFGLKLKPYLLIKFETIGISFNLLLLLFLWVNNDLAWADPVEVLIIFVVIEILVLLVPFTGTLVQNAEPFDGLTVLESIKTGFVVLAASAYSMLIVLDVSRELVQVGGMIAAAFSTTYFARSALGIVSSGLSTFIISTGDRKKIIPFTLLLLGFVTVFLLILVLSYATLAVGLVSTKPVFKDLLLTSIFFSSIFISSLVNSELFRKSGIWSAASGVTILASYFVLKHVLSGGYASLILSTSVILCIVPTILLRRLGA